MSLSDFGSLASIVSLIFGLFVGFSGCKIMAIFGHGNVMIDNTKKDDT